VLPDVCGHVVHRREKKEARGYLISGFLVFSSDFGCGNWDGSGSAFLGPWWVEMIVGWSVSTRALVLRDWERGVGMNSMAVELSPLGQ